MYKVNNLLSNLNIKIVKELGGIKVLEYQRDLSVTPSTAVDYYFSSKMNCHRRQVLIELNNDSYVLQAGAMQWTVGDVSMSSGIKSVGDFAKKAFVGKVTGESAVKPEYKGNGLLMLEPTFKHIILEDVSKWKGMVIDDGMFLASESTVKHTITRRSNISSAIAGGEGIFNLCLEGNCIVALESRVPESELIEFVLQNDEVKIDGNMAVAWSKSLQFTVERTSKTLIGSAASGEGLVNVYRGTGNILMAPVLR